ncbi:MAG: non-heme iron oxygenase ferredoxin subunit [Candidatus Thermoplasmatota archaeon]|jgi:nitrite reductase/ring-hydroxylating ferredoxin subunit|nr:non-heme iron oxygenase ferredoxin subunit [Candidatus Sysuiplasma jiujiangense]MBX8638921.1 non-heme iron oxygenase ferredoxin subunit [Candidatus Sysuiplasma jiujiangense]MBX8641018.1 non-heme iron oxygenase ferredoxin subunit [Candidatus Sysuiplasma jiujiangense]MCL4318037.1 non-heme iron oxygenase ferredoxin subunit [Candidatus Thermoplasmatota archaeon]MCL5253502.1 non-heme iron oxygenase ferredoxin subunit [Candidatus Thermoplasmatota archaeon]
MPFKRTLSLKDMDSAKIMKVELDGNDIMIIRLGDNYHALDATCTHEDADLSRGILMGNAVVCPLHLSRFNLETGAVESPPATEPLKKYNVKIEDGYIYVEV